MWNITLKTIFFVFLIYYFFFDFIFIPPSSQFLIMHENLSESELNWNRKRLRWEVPSLFEWLLDWKSTLFPTLFDRKRKFYFLLGCLKLFFSYINLQIIPKNDSFIFSDDDIIITSLYLQFYFYDLNNNFLWILLYNKGKYY